MSKCELCGEPMPAGEQAFKFHGYSGPCPKPPAKAAKESQETAEGVEAYVARGVLAELLWSAFENEDGTYTICQCVTDSAADSGYTEGNAVGVVESREQAERIVDIHNATVAAAAQ